MTTDPRKSTTTRYLMIGGISLSLLAIYFSAYFTLVIQSFDLTERTTKFCPTAEYRPATSGEWAQTLLQVLFYPANRIDRLIHPDDWGPMPDERVREILEREL